MVKARAFHHDDVLTIGPVQKAQEGDDPDMMRAGIRRLAMQGPAWTAVAADGRIVGMGGVAIQWGGYARAWAYVVADTTQADRMEAAREAMRLMRLVEKMGFRRIDATVREDFEPGKAFIARLGFQREAAMQAFGPDGADHGLWAKVAA